MFLTKERDYAMRAVCALSDMKQQSVKNICKNVYIPVGFAYKILKKLEKNGIAYAEKGKYGGYRLAKKPEEISMLDVLLAIDTRLFVNEDFDEESSDDSYRIKAEFDSLQEMWTNTLKERTVDMLVAESA